MEQVFKAWTKGSRGIERRLEGGRSYGARAEV